LQGRLEQQKEELIEEACKDMVLHLLLDDARQHHPRSKMILKQANWATPIEELLATIAVALGMSPNVEIVQQPHTSRSADIQFEEPEDPIARAREVKDLLEQISRNEHGWADLSKLKK
jgi:hypothetical protein